MHLVFKSSASKFVLAAALAMAAITPSFAQDAPAPAAPRLSSDGSVSQIPTAPPIDPQPGHSRQKLAITAKAARDMIDAIVAYATQQRQAVSICIVDEGGNLLAFHRMDDASLGTVDAAMNKTPSALKLQRGTSGFVTANNLSTGIAFTSVGIAVLGGASPIKIGNTVVGAIGVSGARDDEYAAVGLAAFRP